MLAFHAITTLLATAFLWIGVQASPLSRRDVIAPKITSPDASTVWTVGSVVTVTWDTSNFPPDSQITNPIGKVILGFDENDSLNLDFNHPLAQDFKLRDGSVQLTVPDVPARDDYLIVLFGDSGNTSPTFAITRISPGSPSRTAETSSTLITAPIPITGSTITGGTLTDTRTESLPTISDSSSAPASTVTSPASTSVSSTASSSTSSSATTSGTAGAANATTTSAAWSVHHGALSFRALSLCMASLAVYIML